MRDLSGFRPLLARMSRRCCLIKQKPFLDSKSNLSNLYQSQKQSVTSQSNSHHTTGSYLDEDWVGFDLHAKVTLGPHPVQPHVGLLHLLCLLRVVLQRVQRHLHVLSATKSRLTKLMSLDTSGSLCPVQCLSGYAISNYVQNVKQQ